MGSPVGGAARISRHGRKFHKRLRRGGGCGRAGGLQVRTSAGEVMNLNRPKKTKVRKPRNESNRDLAERKDHKRWDVQAKKKKRHGAKQKDRIRVRGGPGAG